MMLSKAFITYCAAAAWMVANASAATSGEPVHEIDWTGFYVGLGGGYFGAETELSNPIFSPISTDTNGGFFGLYLGFNKQVDRVVLGIEGDTYFGLGGDTRFASLPGPSSIQRKEGLSWSVRGRVGWEIGRLMPYVTGGYAGMINKLSFATGFVGSVSESLHGWTVGGGAEYAITNGWLLRLDYRYAHFGDRSYFRTVGPFAPSGIEQNVSTNQVTFGAAYKF